MHCYFFGGVREGVPDLLSLLTHCWCLGGAGVSPHPDQMSGGNAQLLDMFIPRM